MSSVPASPSASGSNPFQNLQQTGAQLERTANGMQQAAGRIAEQAATPSEPKTEPKGVSAARLEDPGFMDRAIQGGVAAGRSSGLSLNLQGSAQSAVPFLDYAGAEANPEVMLQDHALAGGLRGDIRYDSAEGKKGSFFLGARGDFAGAGNTTGVAENAPDLLSLYGQAQGLQGGLSGLQSRVNDLSQQLQNNPDFQRLGQLAGQAAQQGGQLNAAAMQELQTLLNNGQVQQLLQDLDSTMGEANQLLGDTRNALNTLGDGTRTMTGSMAMRGAGELYGGYRTPGYDLGNSGWKVRFGVEASVILPMPNKMDTPEGFPEFKYMMGKVTTQAQMTTRGIEQLQQNLGAVQENLNTLRDSVQNTGQAVDRAAGLANRVNPNVPASVLANLGQISQTVNQLNTAAGQASAAGQGLNQSLGEMEESLNQVTVEQSVTMTTVAPTAPVGFGIRDIGANFYGPVTETIDANVEVGVMNPVGFLAGQENRYQLTMDENQNPSMEKISSKNRNVFHDFYDPAVYVGAGALLNKDSENWNTRVNFRLEQSLSDSTLRGSATVRQQVGPISLRTGVLNTDLRNGGQNMYMAGVGLGRKDQFTVNVASDSLNPNKASNVMVTAGFKIPF